MLPETSPFQGLGTAQEIETLTNLVRAMARNGRDELFYGQLDELDTTLKSLCLLGAMLEQAFTEYRERLS